MGHFYVAHHTVKARQGGGGRAARYLERRGEYAAEASQLVGYNERSHGRKKDYTDLRHREVAHFPAWAHSDANLFFETAARQERANGRWATSIQASLPRGLSHEQQVELTRTFVQTHLPHRPTLWVIHEPLARRDHLPQPHVHILYSERLMHDGIERSPEQMFRRYNATHPERGGCQKMGFGGGDYEAPYRFREAWYAAANMMLEQAGIEERMDPRSFETRGIARKPVRYIRSLDHPRELEAPLVDDRTPTDRAREQAMAAAWWEAWKHQHGLTITPTMDRLAAYSMLAEHVYHPTTRSQGRNYVHPAEETPEGITTRLHHLTTYLEHLEAEEAWVATRTQGGKTLRPTETVRVEQVIGQGRALGLVGEREVVYRGVQIDLRQYGRERTHGYSH